MEKEEYAVCDEPECGTPLVSTMIVDQKERLCLGCGATYGMFGVERREATPELAAMYDMCMEVFKAVRPFIVPRGLHGRVNCKVEDNCRDHGSHLTEEEKLRDYVGRKFLGQIVYGDGRSFDQ